MRGWGVGGEGNSDGRGAAVLPSALCPVPYPRVSSPDPQWHSRPGSSLHRGKDEESGKRAALLRPGARPGVHSALRRTFPFGVGAG